MGYSKKLYNVLGGYKSIIANCYFMVNANLSQLLQYQPSFFSKINQILTVAYAQKRPAPFGTSLSLTLSLK